MADVKGKLPLRRHSFKQVQQFTYNIPLSQEKKSKHTKEEDPNEGKSPLPRHSFKQVQQFTYNIPQKKKSKQTKEGQEVEYERIRQSGRERFKELSKPRDPKVEWWTNVGPNVMWGTQEMMWPVSRSIPEATDRVKMLATPKKNFETQQSSGRPIFYYSCGRPSMVWELKPLQQSANARVQDLAKSKETHKDHREDRREFLYSCGRNTPIWLVSKGAKQAEDRPRTRQLAEPKQPPKEYEGARQIETIIPPSAMKGEASERVQSLSNPKVRPEGPFRDPQWPVASSAKNASSTERCSELSRAKSVPEAYLKPRDEKWAVSRPARRATATPRLQELSAPIVRDSMDHVQFNPDAFLVRPTALKGRIPARIEQLSKPRD